MSISIFIRIIIVTFCCLPLFDSVVSGTMKCNGMEELCELRLNQVTLPGTHNSGSGFNGHLYHWGGGIAGSSLWRNQQWSFTRQLDYGIRYFDIDTCYVDKEYSDWWTKGAWACHMGMGTAAYAGPVKKILQQINDWLNKPEHLNEVVVIKFGRDVEVDFKPERIYKSILADLKNLGWKPTPSTKSAKSLTANAEFGKNYQWPKLRDAINTNQRVFLFFSEKLMKFSKPSEFRGTPWIITAEREVKITWPDVGGDCSGVVDKIVKNCKKFKRHGGLLELDVFGFSVTVSTWAMQGKCDKYMQKSMDECFAVTKKYHKTVNAVLADWVDRSKSPNTVLDVARKQNERNIAMFKINGR
ncbi:uncharacterized protein LOC116300067 [Actinia tenebrosa]|uniref:Uncharacterized protein LOC116300067 n=1 Tax=Actinia tenebrosa TaxID=6105 RepID=A0A6P8IET0_ACTTE|nr:uncharacterized protein LOC116300067 [Actinia tenebrosa]